MTLTEITTGTRLIIMHEGRRIEATVNGAPYVVGITDVEPTEVGVRIPVHVAAANANIDVAGANVWAVLS